jgi:hypothetical protein
MLSAKLYHIIHHSIILYEFLSISRTHANHMCMICVLWGHAKMSNMIEYQLHGHTHYTCCRWSRTMFYMILSCCIGTQNLHNPAQIVCVQSVQDSTMFSCIHRYCVVDAHWKSYQYDQQISIAIGMHRVCIQYACLFSSFYYTKYARISYAYDVRAYSHLFVVSNMYADRTRTMCVHI